MRSAPAITTLLDELGRLPGIGPKSAQRITYWLLNVDEEVAFGIADAIRNAKTAVHFCSRCFNYAQDDLCALCQDSSRDAKAICVVSEPRDIEAIENSGVYNGLYHVLGGALAPLEGVGPDDLRVRELMARLGSEDVSEVILATNPNVDGEITASYLARLIKPLGITVTRPASGMPVGGDLEFIDEVTLGRAMEARREI